MNDNIPEGVVINREVIDAVSMIQDDPALVSSVSTFIDILVGHYLKEADFSDDALFYRNLGLLQLARYALVTIAGAKNRDMKGIIS